MLCPGDGSPIDDSGAGVTVCRRCKGRAFDGATFARLYPGVRDLFIADNREHDSACPTCSVAMRRMRLGKLEAWLDVCETCGLIWVQKAERSVVDGLKAHPVRGTAARSGPRKARRYEDSSPSDNSWEGDGDGDVEAFFLILKAVGHIVGAALRGLFALFTSDDD